MECTLHSLAERIRGALKGDGSIKISGARPLTSAGPQDLSFVVDDYHRRELAASRAAAVICKPGQETHGKPAIECDDPHAAFSELYLLFHPQPAAPAPGIDARTFIDPSVKLGPACSIQPFVSIGAGAVLGARCRLYPGVSIGRDCKLGDSVTLYPNVVLYDGCTLGNRVIIHANAVIGADGFGYRFEQGRHLKVPQYGGVVIEDDVEIGAGTTIDRGAFEPTVIGQGTKLDNLVMIAHNCKIGKHNLIVSQVGIAGSSSTGDYVVMAGQVGVADHVHVGDRAVLGAQCGVHKDIPAGWKVLGAPARPEKDAKVILLSMDKLPELRQDVKQIKRHLGLVG
jgi:UDP-3-O-[3-hydroxymyristoyl] glucosamine N-acyltransferase